MNDRVEAHRDSRIGGIFGEGALRVRTCTSGSLERLLLLATDERLQKLLPYHHSPD